MPRTPNKKLPPLNLGNEHVGQRLSRFRKNKGYTQLELANLVGLTREAVSTYENGRARLHDEMVARFALVLNVSTDELLGLKNSRTIDNSMSLRMARRIKEIERLSEKRKKAILRTIDDLIKANS